MSAIGEARFQSLLARSTPLDEAELRRLSPMLIISPHQDDETLGVGGLLATASALGLRPRVAYLTDGSASHRGSTYWTRERLARLRKRRRSPPWAISAYRRTTSCSWAGATPTAIRCGSIEHDNAALALKRWTADRPPASVWSTWAGEKHCDHEAAASVAELFRDGADPRPAGFSFVVWGWNEDALDTAANPRSLTCPETVRIRRRALARHESQTTTLISDAAEASAWLRRSRW